MTQLWSTTGLNQLSLGGTPLLLVAFRTVVIYFVMVLGLRLTGKREIGQFTPFDLVLVLLIANAVQNAMVGPDNTLVGGMVAALVLFAINWLVGRVVGREPRVRRWLLGEPRLLMSDGRYIDANMRAEEVTPDEVEAAAREHGIGSVDDVQLAVLEVDGSISIVPKDSQVLRSRRRVRQIKHGQ
jgi:uncharacterized membrane protein YcaP (DUF421 family)